MAKKKHKRSKPDRPAGRRSASSDIEHDGDGGDDAREATKAGDPAKAKSDDASSTAEASGHGAAPTKASAKGAKANESAPARRFAKTKPGRAKGRDALPNARTVAKPGDARPEPTAPAFWFGFEIPWAKLLALRVVVFGLLAVDALLQIRHAPRYGAGGFNVANLGFLDDLGPGRVGYSVGQLLIAYFLVLAAFGVGTRVVLPIATVIYAWLYFGSQLDSYQHHYLVSLVLAIACFVPWHRPPDPDRSTMVRSWALRLILVQLGIMYLWAAISKLDPMWLDGRTLDGQVGGTMRSLIISTIGFKVMSIIVVVVEFGLALTVWNRRAWIAAAPIGVLFHIGIIVTGFEIGLFAYLMVALYILVIPDRVWVVLAGAFGDLGKTLHDIGQRPGWLMIGAGVIVAICLSLVVRLPSAIAIAATLSIVPIAAAARRVMRGGPPVAVVAIAHVVAIALWLVVDRPSTIAEDYYRYWGGSLRRLGDKAQAEDAYRSLISIAPNDVTGHFQLGRILLATDRIDDGLAELHEAQRLDPHHARTFAEEARWLEGRGRHGEALAKAREGAEAEPSDEQARALLENLRGSKPAPRPAPDVDP